LERPDALRRAGERSRGLVSLARKLNFPVSRIAQLYVCGIRNAIRRGNLLWPRRAHDTFSEGSHQKLRSAKMRGDEFAAQ